MPAAVTVRAARLDDAAAIQSIYAPAVLESYASFEQVPPDVGELARRMSARPRLPWLVACEARRVLGYAYASPHGQRPAYRWSVDVSVYLDPGARRRGIARDLYEQLLTELAALGYVSAFAGIALPNDGSVRLHEAAGFEPLGVFGRVGFKNGAWRDVGWWRRELREPPGTPAEPREWTPAR